MTSLEPKNGKLELANKLIFVRSYDKAKHIIDSLIDEEGAFADPLIHLRRIELATKLNALNTVRADLERRITADQSNQSLQSLLILLELHDDQENIEAIDLQIRALQDANCSLPEFYYACGFAMELKQNWARSKFFYERCIESDSTWYPAFFGLSQIFYQIGDDSRGDQFFILYEQSAPFNVYGNFETHRNLSEEFLSKDLFTEAEEAITSLSEWWIENKGKCPKEIKIFEYFSLSRINERRGNHDRYIDFYDQAMDLAEAILEDDKSTESMLLFVARVAEDFGNSELALACYKGILKLETKSPEMVQRIGSQFFSIDEYSLAEDLFYEAYTHQPDNPDIRFCLLVARLKLSGANVEEYLIGKERIKSLDAEENGVELLSLLHAMLANYDQDPDIHAYLGDLYFGLGNNKKAAEHFDLMMNIDSYSSVAKLKFASFLVNISNFSRAEAILQTFAKSELTDPDSRTNVEWLKALISFHKKNYRDSIILISRCLSQDPWNVAFIVQKCLALSKISESKMRINATDSVLIKLSKSDEENLDWESFDRITEALLRSEFFELVYERERVRYLYKNEIAYTTNRMLHAAVRFDPKKACFDFLKLINTNFDTPSVYWVLGMLRKELFQFETARSWFEHILEHPKTKDLDRSYAYLDIADCLLWQDIELFKALEYARLSNELQKSSSGRNFIVLAHANLKVGKPQLAIKNLEKITNQNDIEAIYIKGLVFYRNGDLEKAKKTWGPLLSLTSFSLKDYLIKETVHSYYFDQKHYLKSN